MTAMQMINSAWQFNITAVIIAILLIAFHIVTNGNKFTRRSWLFFAGIFLLLLVTCSPLAFLGRNYLFSAHMIESITLLLIVPPLLLTGTSSNYMEKLMQKPAFKQIGKVLFYPILAWLAGIGAMWIWHIPKLMIAVHGSQLLQIIHLTSLLILGTIFIWPVYVPTKLRKLQPLVGSVYLFIACVSCTVLGIYITFAPEGVFTSYLAGGNIAIIKFIQSDWGVTPNIDQEMAGLIMWVPACIVYLTNIMITLFRWYGEPEYDTEKSEVRKSETLKVS